MTHSPPTLAEGRTALEALSDRLCAPLPDLKVRSGTVVSSLGQTVEVAGLQGQAGLGARIAVESERGEILGEVTSDNGKTVGVALYGLGLGITSGRRARLVETPALRPGPDWLGRVLDHDGRDAQGRRPQAGTVDADMDAPPPPPGLRRTLGARLSTGYAAFDTFLPLCRGQRIGLFAGSGVGKTSLLGGLASQGDADINVIALIGERGREVRAFVEEVIGEEAMKRSVVFAATSDQPPAIKLRTARLAMAAAESFRDQGHHVLFLFDSLTRYAQAHREVALAAGEPPALRAFPPSTFPTLARLCERAGPGSIGQTGDITAVFSVLVQGSDMEEPVADTVRGILDGHVILDRAIAEGGRYPAINIGRSVSRSLPDAATETENMVLSQARSLIRAYEDGKLMVQSGLYAPGSDPVLDRAVACHDGLEAFLTARELGDFNANFAALAATIGIEVKGEPDPT